MLKITLIVLAVLAVGIVGILAYAATRPDDFRVQRSAVINARRKRFSRSSTTSSSGARGRPTRSSTRA